MFIGRKKELGIINEKLNNNNFELGVIYGQRRIGKTSTILECLKNQEHIYFLARQDTYQNNLTYFTNEYIKQFNIPYPVQFDTFDQLFDSILKVIQNKKFTIVIDELPFLAKAYPGIVSYLQNLADELKRNDSQLKILLSGSDISFMIDILENKAKPLYQRATFKIHIKPMVFSDAVNMLQGFDDVDIIRYLSVFGNRPYYLEKLDKNKSFDENMINLCFNATSILVDAPNITLPIGYSSNSAYISILTSISNHKQKVKEIADNLHIDENALSTYLGRMLEGESIERKEMFNGNRKTNYYDISDPFIRFYYCLIYLNLPNIERNLGQVIYENNKPIVEDIINHGFEDVVNSYMDEMNANNKLPHVYNSFKKLSVDNSPLGRPIQIDGLADSIDGKCLLAIETKFKNKNLSKEVLDHLKESVSIFANKYSEIHYYVFSKTGFSNDLLSLGDKNVSLISLKDMVNLEERK